LAPSTFHKPFIQVSIAPSKSPLASASPRGTMLFAPVSRSVLSTSFGNTWNVCHCVLPQPSTAYSSSGRCMSENSPARIELSNFVAESGALPLYVEVTTISVPFSGKPSAILSSVPQSTDDPPVLNRSTICSAISRHVPRLVP
jgi:hypothetical protein